MSLSENKGLNKVGGCSCRALWSFWLQVADPPRCTAMIVSGLRDFTQESYPEIPRLVRLNVSLVSMPLARVHFSALQSWSVTPVNSK